jgi:hypothetical protein
MATIAIGIAPSKGGGATASVPIDALSQEGVPPSQGDDVSFSVDGTVQSVSGNSARVKINAIDGNPVGAGAGAESETGPGEGPGESETGPGEPGNGGGLSGMSAADLGAKLKKGAKGRPMPLM